MMSPTELWQRARYWWNRDALTRDLEEEMRLHLELRAEQSGANAAHRRFGNTTNIQQRSRDMWGFGRLEDFTNDVRFAWRRLKQRPAFTAAVVGVMAIGIGATTAMFSAVDAALLRPLPFKDPGQLAVLNVSVPFQEDGGPGHPQDRSFDLTDVAAMQTTFSDVAAYGNGALDLADPANPSHLNAGIVTYNLFQTLGVQPVSGRNFVEAEGKTTARVVMISYGLWQRVYGGRDIAGLTIKLAQQSYEVVGVMPRGFGFPRQSDVWLPMAIPNTLETLRPFGASVFMTTIGRLKSGVSAADASARMLSRWKQIRNAAGPLPSGQKDYVLDGFIERGGANPLQQALVGERKTALLVLLGATGLLLLVACVNVTNLLLSQGAARAREIAVRQVLGATRVRIVRQLLTESIVLSLGGAILGIALAPIALRTIASLTPKSLVGLAPAHVDWRILLFATALAIVTGVAFGMWPALGDTRRDSSDIIKSGGGHGSTAAHGSIVRRALVGVELAMTTMLLIGAGLMLQSFRELMSRDMGMQTENVGTLQLSLRRSAENDSNREFRMQAILDRFAEMPDISAAGFVNDLPLAPSNGLSLRIDVDGAQRIKSDDPEVSMTRWLRATGGYFPAMGIKLIRGRLFTSADGPDAPRVAIVGERMAKAYWKDRDAIGGTLRLPADSIRYTVIGVVSDVREYNLEKNPQMQLYLSAHAKAPTPAGLVVRSRLPEKQLLARMQATIRTVDPAQAIYSLRMMDDVVSNSIAPRRTNTTLIGAFALLALVLASLGIYAVVSYSVSHRARELGIRSALGATASNLMRMISGEMTWVLVTGIAVGVGGAWALAKTLESLVYGVSVHDTPTFVIVPAILIFPFVAATLIPARRVLKVDPAQVMRAD